MSETTSITSGDYKIPITHEREFLETYFYSVAQFLFEHAHELAEKERNSSPQNHTWSVFLPLLVTLANAEKNYFAMAFVEKKIFKQTLKPVYNTLSSDLLKTADGASKSPSGSEAICVELCKQLHEFARARIQLIDFYENFVQKSKWNLISDLKELTHTVSHIKEEHDKHFHHPILDPLKSCFLFEVNTLLAMLSIEFHLCEWEFLDSLLMLRDCHLKLHEWRNFFLSPSTTLREELVASFSRSIFQRSSKKQAEIPTLYQWLNQLHYSLLSKFSLYFYTTLQAQTLSGDLKTAMSKNTIDYISKIQTFQKKTDPSSISLVLHTNNKRIVFKGHGYHMDNTLTEAPTGINSFPSIVNIPDPPAKEHWPIVVSWLTGRGNDLSSGDKIGYLYDPKLDSSFFFVKVDARMTLILIYRMKKKERDSAIQNFLLDMKNSLKHDKLFLMLRPGQSKTLFK